VFVLTISVLLVSAVGLNAQVTEEWVARYDGLANGLDIAKALAIDDEDNVYVTGYSDGSGTNSDYATLKYNSSGVEQWAARYDGPASFQDGGRAMAIDGEGNIYVTGMSWGSGTSDDYATVKYGSTGVQQWVARYDGPGSVSDGATAIAIDGEGNIYVTGTSGEDYATVKYNSSGVQQWEARYDGPGDDEDYATAMAIDDAGNVYVTGWSLGSEADNDYATVKYNSSGVEQWAARYDGPAGGDDLAFAVGVDGSGNVYATGTSSGDYATVKYNSSGVEQWAARYDGPASGNDLAFAMAVDGSGNVYAAGTSSGDYATVKYSPSGAQQWVARYDGPASGGGVYAIAVDGTGSVYVTGYSEGSGTSTDYATVKYNSSGGEEWVVRYDGPASGNDEAFALALDGIGNVYVTGLSDGSGTGWDYATIKYSQDGGIAEKQKPEIADYELQVAQLTYAPAGVEISYFLPVSTWLSLRIYDATGREVKTLVSERSPAGEHRVTWDGYDESGAHLSQGVYFVRLEAGSFNATKKVILHR